MRRGAYPAPLNYKGFPEEPAAPPSTTSFATASRAVLRRAPGTSRNVDVTTLFNGFHGDTSATFYVGAPSAEARLVTETARKALELGIAGVREGAAPRRHRCRDRGIRRGDRLQCGARLRRSWHRTKVPRATAASTSASAGTLERLRAGMVFTIEPMVNIGGYEVVVDELDKWTVRTHRRLVLSAQFEHTVLVTRSGAEI